MSDWESIVRTHGPMAFDTAWRLLGNSADAEEVVQDALMDAFRLHSQRVVDNWGGLLRRLAVCRAIDHLRSRQSVQPFTHEPASAESDRPDVAAIERELAERLRWAITKLVIEQKCVKKTVETIIRHHLDFDVKFTVDLFNPAERPGEPLE